MSILNQLTVVLSQDQRNIQGLQALVRRKKNILAALNPDTATLQLKQVYKLGKDYEKIIKAVMSNDMRLKQCANKIDWSKLTSAEIASLNRRLALHQRYREQIQQINAEMNATTFTSRL